MKEWLAGFLPGSKTAAAWLLVGLIGQVMFASRWLVQLVASERQGRSTMPEAFWWLSVLGGLLVLAYGLHARDAVVVIGQWGVAVYLRNLVLLKRARERVAEGTRT